MSGIQINFQDLALDSKTVKHITFVGQLDETNVDHEAKRVYQVITEMAVPVLFLDFSGLEYMNSKSIGYVTDWFTQATAKQGSISIISPKPNILDILKVVGITQIITIYNSLDEAKAALGNTADATPTSTAPAPVEPTATTPAEPTPAAETPLTPTPTSSETSVVPPSEPTTVPTAAPTEAPTTPAEPVTPAPEAPTPVTPLTPTPPTTDATQ